MSAGSPGPWSRCLLWIRQEAGQRRSGRNAGDRLLGAVEPGADGGRQRRRVALRAGTFGVVLSVEDGVPEWSRDGKRQDGHREQRQGQAQLHPAERIPHRSLVTRDGGGCGLQTFLARRSPVRGSGIPRQAGAVCRVEGHPPRPPEGPDAIGVVRRMAAPGFRTGVLMSPSRVAVSQPWFRRGSVWTGPGRLPSSCVDSELTIALSPALAPNDFTHLHVHSEFSLLDGLGRITELVDAAAATGLRLAGAHRPRRALRRGRVLPGGDEQGHQADHRRRDLRRAAVDDRQGGQGRAQPFHLILLAKD